MTTAHINCTGETQSVMCMCLPHTFAVDLKSHQFTSDLTVSYCHDILTGEFYLLSLIA